MANKSNAQRILLETRQVPWFQLREKVVIDDAVEIGVTTQDYANRNLSQ